MTDMIVGKVVLSPIVNLAPIRPAKASVSVSLPSLLQQAVRFAVAEAVVMGGFDVDKFKTVDASVASDHIIVRIQF